MPKGWRIGPRSSPGEPRAWRLIMRQRTLPKGEGAGDLLRRLPAPSSSPSWSPARNGTEKAPRVGLEPTTNRLHLPPRFRGEWTISSPAWGAGRSRLAYWSGSAPDSLCTFPATHRPVAGLGSGLPPPSRAAGSLNSPRVSAGHCWPGLQPLTAGCSTIELSGKQSTAGPRLFRTGPPD